MSINLKDDILNAVRESKVDKTFGPKTPKFRKPTTPPQLKPPAQTNPNYTPPASEKSTCTYETPCGWCTKWDKKCDKKPYKRGLRVEINPVDDAIGVLGKEIAVNQICYSEEDHEWECCGMSTEGSHYRCKKCGKYKFEPYTTSTSSYYKGELI